VKTLPELNRRIVLAALAGLSLLQCGRPIFIASAYPGPPRERAEIGVLRVLGDEPAQLISVDGEAADARVSEDAALHLELLPGRHTVFVQDIRAPQEPPGLVRFQVTPGGLYGVRFTQGPAEPQIFTLDPSSYAALTNVTLKPEPPKPPPPSVLPPATAPAEPTPIEPASPAPTSAEPTTTAPSAAP